MNFERLTLSLILMSCQMSATLDAKLFEKFFMGAPLVNVPGR
jgi:HrpA-like RNA helicase